MFKFRGLAAMVAAFVLAAAAPLPAQQPTDGERDESRRLVERIRAWIEKQRDRYDVAADRLESVGLAPEIGTLGHGSGLAAGLRFRRGLAPGIDAEAAASFSYRGYERYDLRVGRLAGRKSRTTLRPADDDVTSQFDAFTDRAPGLGFYADLRYRHSPQIRFFGIGSDTAADDRTSFLARGASYDLVAEYQPRKWLGVAARAGVLDLEVGPAQGGSAPSTGAVFDERTAPALSQQPLYVHAGAALVLDRRDSASAPRSGGLLGLLAWRFDALDTAAADFSRVALDGRYFVPVTVASVVALRAVTSMDIGDGRGRVPFYLQQTLGGGDTLRGFERARFRGPSLVNLSAEYRWDVHPWIELAGFGDGGQVGSSLRTLAPRRLETSWGAGVRVKKSGAVKFRLDFATSREGRRLIFSTSPAF